MADKDKILAHLQKVGGWHTSFQVASQLGYVNGKRDDRKVVSEVLKRAESACEVLGEGKGKGKRYSHPNSQPAQTPSSEAPKFERRSKAPIAENSEAQNAVLQALKGQEQGLRLGDVSAAAQLDKPAAREALLSLISAGRVESSGSHAHTRYHSAGTRPLAAQKTVAQSIVAPSRPMPPPTLSELRRLGKLSDTVGDPPPARKRRARSDAQGSRGDENPAPTVAVSVEDAVQLAIAQKPRGEWFVPWDIAEIVHDLYGHKISAAREVLRKVLRSESSELEVRNTDDDGANRVMVRRPFVS